MGIGDSGTRGVASLLRALGLAMSDDTNDAGDDIMSRPALLCTLPMLNASEGHISHAGYRRNAVAWQAAVTLEQLGVYYSHKKAAPREAQAA